jgi:outer membrane lipoprotein-sorting protein
MRIAVCILLLALTTTTPISLSDQLRQVDDAAAHIKDLTAHFEQRKYTALLTEPLISSGQVRSAGSVVRWDTQEPSAIVLYANRTQLRLYYPDQKLEEIYAIDRRMSDLLSSPLPRLSTIKEHFTIEVAGADDLTGLPSSGATLSLRLTPDDAALAAHVRRVIVVLDMKTGTAVAVRTIDPDDDHTDIIFSAVQINSGLDEQSLELAVPAETTISHPMASAPASNHANH